MKSLPVLMATLVTGLMLIGLSIRSWSPANQSVAESQHREEEQDVQVFVGTVIKDGDEYALKNESSNISYRLDDWEKARGYEGKPVKVNGSLDSATNTIRVSNLEPNG
jgi:uncharacterized protein YdeI (BOF family)